MCDQIPVQVCNQLTPAELMSLEILQCERRNVDAHSSVLAFLMDTFYGSHPSATDDDRIIIGMELLRISWGIPNLIPSIPKITSQDLIRLGYGCSHAAA